MAKEEESTEEVKTNGEADAEEVAAEGVAEEEFEDSDKLPFPMATVVRHIRGQTPNKMISSKVKVAMNQFMGDIIALIARDMGQTRYSMIEMDDFERATKAYVSAKEFESEKNRVVKELERMKSNIDSMTREFQRKFSIKSADDTQIIHLEEQPITEAPEE